MKSVVLAAALCVGLGSVASAATIRSGEVPRENYVTIDGADWAWAMPCGAGSSSCWLPNQLDLSEQSHYGWRLPTADEVTKWIGLSSSAFMEKFRRDDGGTVCAAGWFNAVWSHCDYGNPVWNVTGESYGETFVMRSAEVAPVPLPAAAVLLLGSLGALGALRRRTKSA